MNLPREEKQQAQHNYKKKLSIQSKDPQRLKETRRDFASLETLPKDSKRLQES